MTRNRASILTSIFALALIAATSPAQQNSAQSNSAQSDEQTATAAGSKVRIVRLSQVRGAVQAAHGSSQSEAAMNNLPIVEGTRLETAVGVAEVEFEDNTTLRMAPDTAVEFPRLERDADGHTISSVRVLRGMVYVSLMKSPGSFNLEFGDHQLAVPPATHLRLGLDSGTAELAVFKGAVNVDTPTGLTAVAKKQTVTFLMAQNSTPMDRAAPSISKSVKEDPFDHWDRKSVDYHDRLAQKAQFGNSPYAYGMSDMMYYGSFSEASGCGSMWRPYFASASWQPYSAGAWAWYQGAGYSWVSPYPWGWTPYHYGSWNFCPGVGWGWAPGGNWNGLNNAVMMRTLNGPGQTPRVPVRPPQPGQPRLTPITLQPVPRSDVDPKSGSFVFRNDSAGLGIPREGLGRLGNFSHDAVSHGMSRTPIYVETHGPANLNGRPAPEMISGTSLHRGSPLPMNGASGIEPSSSARAGMNGSGSAPAHGGAPQPVFSAPSVRAGGGGAPAGGGGGPRVTK